MLKSAKQNQANQADNVDVNVDVYVNDNVNDNVINTTTSTNNIYNYIEENFGRTLSPVEYEQISKWEDNELTRYAIKQAVLNGAYRIKYIESILNDYEKNGIKTVQEAQEKEKEFKKIKEEIERKLYELAEGKVLNEERARHLIEKMRPFGKKWELIDTENVRNNSGYGDIRPIDFWIVMNSAYNDYNDIFKEDVGLYARFSKDFIMDEDAVEDKVYYYFTMIPKE